MSAAAALFNCSIQIVIVREVVASRTEGAEF
jgi:hypothetical protein